MARLLARLADGLSPNDADRYLIRDGQRIIESMQWRRGLIDGTEKHLGARVWMLPSSKP